MIGIIDYGLGNLRSVANALTYLGHESRIITYPNESDGYSKLILPGVGSFARAMENLNQSGWADAIDQHVESGGYLLGICLGMQLLLEVGEEHGISRGLGLISGTVKLINPGQHNRNPHMGWNSIKLTQKHPLFSGIKEHVDFYFVHSYSCRPTHSDSILATTEHGEEFVSAISLGRIAGVQFHPEKSQPSGMKLLENFVSWEV